MSIETLPSLPVQPSKSASEKNSRFDRWWILVALVTATIIFLVTVYPTPYKNLAVFVRDGVWRTTYITIISFIIVVVFGLVVGLARLSKVKIINGIATVYVEIIRGIPMLVQIIYWYYAMPAIIKSLARAGGFPPWPISRQRIVMAIVV